MRHALHILTAVAMLPLATASCYGQSLQEALDDTEVDARWKYNDWNAAKSAAARSGKPIAALFR